MTHTLSMLAALALAGCAVSEGVVEAPVAPYAYYPVAEKRAVVFGMDYVSPAYYGGWRGECPGAVLDATRMAALLTRKGYGVVLLTNESATAYRVTAACVASALGMPPGGRLFVYGAGHGGQVEDKDGDEAKDSTLCLYDGQYTDDLVWALLSRAPAGLKIDLTLDMCNTGSSYRAPHDYIRVLRARGRGARAGLSELKCSLFYSGGCGDGESSYGGPTGGVFTSARLTAWVDGMTRLQWHEATLALMPRNQRPVWAEYGPSIKNEEALK